ncbi:complement component C1q receptor-like [Cottoperca gobio]|uniref:Thrombomodulin n=1 Tax=Cottoperca gobio TaxID=56716 RepID=A0A6J2S4R4_COTGO|nr:complement component C1q receptor-like [Cottoperca gobio]
MACLQLTACVLLKVTTMTILMSVVFFLSMKTGLCIKQTGVCSPFCIGNDCITVNQDRVDFQTAEEACRDRNGELLTFRSETDESSFDILSQRLFGDFWIGLHLPAVACSNLSVPLRGYEWTSGSVHRSVFPFFSTWKDSVKVCSPRCVSLSNDQKLNERLCSDKPDGFLCRTTHKDACRAQQLSDPKVIQSSAGCSDGPCEHECTNVKGGYLCSCFRGYIPDNEDPRLCNIHCAQQKCPAICERNTNSSCFCPEGFVFSETFCEDIDECSNFGCDQECENTFGGFVCSCQEGFVLKDQVKCIKAEGGERLVVIPIAIGFVKPSTDNHTWQGASAPAGGLLWLWIFLVAAVAVFIIVIRFYVVKRQKSREQNSNQQSAAPVDNIEC